MEPDKHKEYTGVSNELILKSARKVASLKVPLTIRIPLIPGYNDSHKNMEECAHFAKEIGVKRIEFLLFHKGQHLYLPTPCDIDLEIALFIKISRGLVNVLVHVFP